jgi:hypothetical protein
MNINNAPGASVICVFCSDVSIVHGFLSGPAEIWHDKRCIEIPPLSTLISALLTGWKNQISMKYGRCAPFPR